MQLLCLEPAVVTIALAQINDIYGMGRRPNEDDHNRGLRHAAYRQFVHWRHGKLGATNRIVIPSCCVLKIREQFPSPTGLYTGYKDNRHLV